MYQSSGFPLSAYGTRRYTSQIETLQIDLRAIYDDLKGRARLDLGEFAAYEAQFNATMLGKVVRAVIQLNVPSVEMVSAAALADPLQLEDRKGVQRISINGALDQFGTKKAVEIIGEIQIGSSLGETSQQISRRLTGIHQLQQDQASSQGAVVPVVAICPAPPAPPAWMMAQPSNSLELLDELFSILGQGSSKTGRP